DVHDTSRVRDERDLALRLAPGTSALPTEIHEAELDLLQSFSLHGDHLHVQRERPPRLCTVSPSSSALSDSATFRSSSRPRTRGLIGVVRVAESPGSHRAEEVEWRHADRRSATRRASAVRVAPLDLLRPAPPAVTRSRRARGPDESAGNRSR